MVIENENAFLFTFSKFEKLTKQPLWITNGEQDLNNGGRNNNAISFYLDYSKLIPYIWAKCDRVTIFINTQKINMQSYHFHLSPVVMIIINEPTFNSWLVLFKILNKIDQILIHVPIYYPTVRHPETRDVKQNCSLYGVSSIF